MSTQKSLATLASNFSTLFSAGTDVSATAFAALIADLMKSLNLPLPLPEVATFTGADNSLENIATVDLAANTLVEIMVSGVLHKFKLVAGNEETLATYYIRPLDYNSETNSKYWQRTDIKIVSFDEGDLSENILTIEHLLGYQFIKKVDVYNVSTKNLLALVYAEPAANEYMQNAYSQNEVKLTFHASITGNHYAIIHL